MKPLLYRFKRARGGRTWHVVTCDARKRSSGTALCGFRPARWWDRTDHAWHPSRLRGRETPAGCCKACAGRFRRIARRLLQGLRGPVSTDRRE